MTTGITSHTIQCHVCPEFHRVVWVNCTLLDHYLYVRQYGWRWVRDQWLCPAHEGIA